MPLRHGLSQAPPWWATKRVRYLLPPDEEVQRHVLPSPLDLRGDTPKSQFPYGAPSSYGRTNRVLYTFLMCQLLIDHGHV